MTKILIQFCLIYSLFLFNNNHKLNAQNLFSEIKGSKIIIDDKSYNSLSLIVSLPKKLVTKECLIYFKKFGEVNIDKKIVYHIIKSEENSKQLNIKTSIENENKPVQFLENFIFKQVGEKLLIFNHKYCQQRIDRLTYLATSTKNMSDLLINLQRAKVTSNG